MDAEAITGSNVNEQLTKTTTKWFIQGVPKNLLESREQYIVVWSLNFVFPGCLTRMVINGARIFLFKSTINWKVDVQ